MTGWRFLLRPIPMLLVFLFAAVAVGDLVQGLREKPEPPPQLLRPGLVKFTPREPVIDFRTPPGDPHVALVPEPGLVGPLWAPPHEDGVWALGDGAAFDLDLVDGEFREVMLVVRPAAGRRRVGEIGLSINGVACGAVEIRRGWQRVVLGLPDGAFRTGGNRVEIEIPDRRGDGELRRAVQLRRMEIRAGGGRPSDVEIARPIDVDFELQSVVISAPGTLEIGFTVDDRVDALRTNYRMVGAGSSGDLTISRPEGGGAGRDAPMRRELVRTGRGFERIRVPLHGRRGEFLLRLRVDPGPERSRVEFRAMALVKEKNRTGAAKDRRR